MKAVRDRLLLSADFAGQKQLPGGENAPAQNSF
jgi:hypothetical protein